MSSAFDQDVLGRLPALTVRGTGTGPLPQNTPTRRIVCHLDQYEVVLAVTEDDRVVGVVEVREKKDFRNGRQKIASTGHFDIEQFINE
jgi:hypothetical protein